MKNKTELIVNSEEWVYFHFQKSDHFKGSNKRLDAYDFSVYYLEANRLENQILELKLIFLY